MKILFIIDSIGKGGKERRMLELIKNLIKSGKYTIILVSLSDLIEYQIVYQLPIELIILQKQKSSYLALFLKLFKIVKKYSPNIIHSWGLMADLYCLPITKMNKIKYITSVIADAPKHLTLRNKLSRFIFHYADIITSNSIAGLNAYNAPTNKSLCIYNGFDNKRLVSLQEKEVIKSKLGVEDKIIIGMVAAFEERKDYATLIAAANEVVNTEPNSVFLLIGEGKLKKEMTTLVSETAKTNVLFLGNIDEVESYINIFDIAILCSNSNVHQEGISNSIMEYMALGKPVVATDGGGTKEIVIDKKTGFLVPPFDKHVLSNRILSLIKFPEMRVEMGNNGKKFVSETFNIENMCSQFYSVYDQLTEAKKVL